MFKFEIGDWVKLGKRHGLVLEHLGRRKYLVSWLHGGKETVSESNLKRSEPPAALLLEGALDPEPPIGTLRATGPAGISAGL